MEGSCQLTVVAHHEATGSSKSSSTTSNRIEAVVISPASKPDNTGASLQLGKIAVLRTILDKLNMNEPPLPAKLGLSLRRIGWPSENTHVENIVTHLFEIDCDPTSVNFGRAMSAPPTGSVLYVRKDGQNQELALLLSYCSSELDDLIAYVSTNYYDPVEKVNEIADKITPQAFVLFFEECREKVAAGAKEWEGIKCPVQLVEKGAWCAFNTLL